jgi:hypothetical protein
MLWEIETVFRILQGKSNGAKATGLFRSLEVSFSIVRLFFTDEKRRRHCVLPPHSKWIHDLTCFLEHNVSREGIHSWEMILPT